MSSLIFFYLAKEQRVKVIVETSLARALTHPLTESDTSASSKVLSTSSDQVQPSTGVATIMFEDQTSPLPTNNKRDLYQDQSPPKEGDLVKWARLSRGTSTGTSTHLLKL